MRRWRPRRRLPHSARQCKSPPPLATDQRLLLDLGARLGLGGQTAPAVEVFAVAERLRQEAGGVFQVLCGQRQTQSKATATAAPLTPRNDPRRPEPQPYLGEELTPSPQLSAHPPACPPSALPVGELDRQGCSRPRRG
eukprot:GHVT01023598.1.p1 GENE.GHVT01023598.1~~GHVT01023598.1.p1  ORF type:complete len:138 (+),score=25.59 GHVT01023598.1:135-548(+)